MQQDLPQNDIIYRKATLEDASELARLRWDFSPDEVLSGAQSFEDFVQQFAVFLAAALEEKIWTIWVAATERQLLGNIYIQPVHKVPRPGSFNRKYGYVTNVYMEPAARGIGIGSRLLQHVIAWAREERLEFLVLWPSEESANYYARAGFHPSPDALELHLAGPE